MTCTARTLAKKDVVILILLYNFKFLGLVPAKFEIFTGRPMYHCKFTATRLCRAYNLILVVIIMIWGVINTNALKKDFLERMEGSFEVIVMMMKSYMRLVAACFSLVLFSLKANEFVQLTNKVKVIMDISQLVSNKTSVSLERVLWNCFKIYIAFDALWIIKRFPWDLGEVMFLIGAYSYFFSVNVANGIFMQYTFFLLFFKHELRILNDTLVDMSLTRVAQLIRLDDKRLRRKKLMRSFKLYTALHSFSQDLSRFYALTMLIAVPQILVALILLIYRLLFQHAKDQWIDSNYPRHIFRSSMLGLLLISIPLTLTIVATDCVHETEKTGRIISSMLMDPQNVFMSDELNKFSIALMFQKIDFTVYGFFSLKEKLMISIGNVLTTYVMIIVQWRKQSTDSMGYLIE